MKQLIYTFKVFILFLCLFQTVHVEAMMSPSPTVTEEKDSTTFKITFLKSTGEPQQDVFIKRIGHFRSYYADANGVITFKHSSDSYLYNANVYFKNNAQDIVKEIPLSLEKTEMTVYIDSPNDINNFRKNNRLFPIEGMVQDRNGEPIERATVSVQGTGRRTLTDEIGLFSIEADYNHPIVVRANGMNNQSLPLSYFLNEEKEPIVTMEPKNSYFIYNSVEKMPSYPGGMKALQNYLDKHLTYPEKAKKAKIEGVVVVQFVIEKDGTISNPKIARHLETTLDTIAWNTVKNMPNWIPGSDYGTTVRCKYSIPVAFKVSKPKPIIPVDSLKLRRDSLLTDSLRTDSLKNSKLLADSLKKDSIKLSTLPTDSLKNDSIHQTVDTEKTTVKVKKRNAFVRFFRWLFGIERRERKRAERAEKAQLLLEASRDSIHLEADSLSINVKDLKMKADQLKQRIDSIATKHDSISTTKEIAQDSLQTVPSVQEEQTKDKEL